MTEWYSVATPSQTERLEEAWSDAPAEAPELCSYILSTAKDQVIAFAPETEFAVTTGVKFRAGYPRPVKIAPRVWQWYSAAGVPFDGGGLETGVNDAHYDWYYGDAPVPAAVPDYDNPSARLVLAQLQQAKSIWNAGRGEVGADGFSFMPRPLEKEIQQMIRPRRGVPNVF